MPEITHREIEGGIPGKWVTTTVSSKLLAQFARADEECPICGARIDDGEQGCPTPEEH